MNSQMEVDINDNEEHKNSFISTTNHENEQKNITMHEQTPNHTQMEIDSNIPSNTTSFQIPSNKEEFDDDIDIHNTTNNTPSSNIPSTNTITKNTTISDSPPISPIKKGDTNLQNPPPLQKIEEHSPTTTTTTDTLDVNIVEEDYEAIAILIDELMKDDPSKRIKAIRSLPIISKALGHQRTRNELIPYITQMIDDDDEVLLVLIEEIYRLKTLNLIGTQEQHLQCLIAPFERLCQVEEKIIRDEACLKFAIILYNMPYKTHEQYFDQHVLPLFQRLCNSDWHTARISGASLIASAFSRFISELNDIQTNETLITTSIIDNQKENISKTEEEPNSMDIDIDIIDKNNTSNNSILTNDELLLKNEMYVRFLTYKQHMLDFVKKLCDDEIPIVRKSAVITLGKMIHALNDKQEVIKEYLPLFLQLAKDEQDNVRVFSIETLLQFQTLFTYEENKNYLLHPIRQLLLDSAWRVRYIAADKFIDICHMLDNKTICESMINYFLRLLTDAESEVRIVAISKIPDVSRIIGVQLSIEKLIPIVCKELIVDSNKYARASLASIIIPFCYLLPHKIVIDHILKCILQILNDEYANVRLHVISNICDDESVVLSSAEDGSFVDKKFDISLLEEAILPSITELTLKDEWRVRLGIIEKFPALAKKFGVELFDEKLFNLCLASLEDSVADVRFSAASNLYVIANAFHLEWTQMKLIPALIKKARGCTNYLFRMIFLLAYQYLCESIGVEFNDLLVTEIIDALEKDLVPNVRFKACQILQFLIMKELVHVKHFEGIVCKLRYLIENEIDPDVQYYAQKCYECISNVYKK